MFLLGFVLVFFMVLVGCIGIQFNRLVFTEAYLEMIRQVGTRFPNLSFDIKINPPFRVVINLFCWVIPIAVFCPVPMGGGMIGWSVLMSNLRL